MDVSGADRHPSCGEDVAPYALGALSPDEARAFERHLALCDLCQSDLAELGPVVDALSDTPEQIAPPPDLKRRIMAVVEEEAAERRAAAQPVETGRVPRRRKPFGRLRTLPALAAACVLLVAGLGIGIGIAVRGDETRTVSGQVASAGATAKLEIEGENGTLMVDRLPNPPRDHVYQVWLVRGTSGRPQPTDALFTADRSGRATVRVPGDLDGVTKVLVSKEPLGGSRQPTTAPSITIAL
jgi:anti-sigma-K factor RskA